MNTIAFLVMAFYGYLLIGFLFALWFVVKGVNTMDEGMRHATWGVRLLLIPGSILLWVVLLRKYFKAANLKPKREQ